MAEQPGNQTPNTLDVNETDLREMKVDELRSKAWELDVFGVSDLRKEELVHAVGGRGWRWGRHRWRCGAAVCALAPARRSP
jgi:hypothetical protein